MVRGQPKLGNYRFILVFGINLPAVIMSPPVLAQLVMVTSIVTSVPILATPFFQTNPLTERAMGRFEQLDQAEQSRISSRAYQTVLTSSHPLCATAAKLENYLLEHALKSTDWELDRSYQAARWAPALKLTTRHWKRGSRKWKRAEKELLGAGNSVSRQNTWEWDYGRNLILEPLKPATPSQQMRALLGGQWPHPGRLKAIAAAHLDDDDSRNQVADYFNHCYRDREGNVFDEILLFEVWDTGYEIEVSDVEAIAWLRLIKKSTKTSSPIPAAKHDLIYSHISNSFETWREYWTLRQALAARIVNPSGTIPARFSGLEGELDTAWALLHHDLEQMTKLVSEATDRASFFTLINELSKTNELPPHSRAGLADEIRRITIEVVTEEGLLGLGRR